MTPGRRQAVVEGEAGRADQEPLGDDARVVAGGEPSGGLFDHLLLLGLEADDLATGSCPRATG